jgi:nucleotide-binding universal stress UspA family protein
METIVVGVDGSNGAHEALKFAAREAGLRKARLQIVSAWEIPPAVYAGGFAPTLDQNTIDGFGEGARKIVQEAIAQAKELEPGIEVDGGVAEGQAAEILLNEAKNADLVVVGNRGLGGFGSLLLGSVSHQVVQHALCPVTVVRQETSS